jgi:hypothetical protein
MNSQTFLLADGAKRVEVHAKPIHFKADDGSWQAIDTTLIATTKAGFTRANVRNVLRSYFPASADGWIRAEADRGAVSFRPLGGAATATAATANIAQWAGLWRNTSLTLTPTAGGLKEAITLASPDAPGEFRFLMRTDGIRAHLNSDRSITLATVDGKPRMVIACPWMQDASGNRSFDVDVSLTDTPQGTVYAMALDPAWLAKATYPVTVDPTVYVADTIWNGTGTNKYPNDERVMRDSCGSGGPIYPDGMAEVLIGPDPLYPGYQCEAVMVFGANLSAIGVPPTATIHSATFHLTVDCDGDEGGDTITVADAPFTSGASTSWTSIEAAYNSDAQHPSATATAYTNGYPDTNFDVTSIAQYWVTKQTAPLGIRLRAENSTKSIYAHAKDNDTLVMVYTVPVLSAGLPGDPTDGGASVTDCFGTNAHVYFPSGMLAPWNVEGVNEVCEFYNANRICRTDLTWCYTDPLATGQDDYSNVLTLLGYMDGYVRPLFILEPVKEGKSWYLDGAGYGPVPGTENATVTLSGHNYGPWGADFATWARKTVDVLSAYPGIIYELGNEPNVQQMTAPEYTDMCVRVLAAVRNSTINPSATLILAGLCESQGDNDWEYEEAVLAKLATTSIDNAPAIDALDGIGIHPYRNGSPAFPPEQAEATYNRLRMLIHKYSPYREIPLVVTEQGYSTALEGNASQRLLAQNTVRQQLFNVGQRIRATTSYDWKDDNFYNGSVPGYPNSPTVQASGVNPETRYGMMTHWPVVADFEDLPANTQNPNGWGVDVYGVSASLATADDPDTSTDYHKTVLHLTVGGSTTVYLRGDLLAPVPPGATSIGMWVYGNLSNTNLTTWLENGNGLQKLDFTKNNSIAGWQYITATASGGFDQCDYQIVCENTSGIGANIYLDNITYVTEASAPYDNLTPKMAYIASHTLVTELEGRRFVRYIQDPSDPLSYLMLFGGSPVDPCGYELVMWTRDTNPDNPHTYHVDPGSYQMTVNDMFGDTVSVTNHDVSLSQSPVYVHLTGLDQIVHNDPNPQYMVTNAPLNDLSSWSWTVPSGNIIDGGAPAESVFEITNPSSNLTRQYTISFSMEDTQGTTMAHDVTWTDSGSINQNGSVSFSLLPGHTQEVPVRLYTYLRTTTTHATINIYASDSGGSWTDSSALTLVLGNPLTLTAGPHHTISSGSGTIDVVTVGIEAPGLRTSADNSLVADITSGFGIDQSQAFALPSTPSSGITPAYSVVNIATNDEPPSPYSYSAQVVDSNDHVIAEASSSFLGIEVYDVTPGGGNWPIGLTVDDDYSVSYANEPVSDAYFDTVLEYYDIDFAHMKIPNTTHSNTSTLRAKIPDADTQHTIVPTGATAIGMWINPHKSYSKLLAWYHDSRIPSEEFQFLRGFRDPAYNFGRPFNDYLLDWEGWRWVTMPFCCPVSHTGAHADPSGTRYWFYPFYIQAYGRSTADIDVTGVTYLR